MKRYYATIILALAALLTSCFKQDLSDCYVEDNVELIFHFKADKDGIEFRNKIFRVDAVIFDSHNQYVTTGSVTKTELDKFAGIRFTLKPGEYRVVCWANLNDNNTQILGVSKAAVFENIYLETISESSGSPLYYGPAREVSESDINFTTRTANKDMDSEAYKVVVESNKPTVKEIEFVRAHRKIDVYIKGYEQMVEEPAPFVQLTNLPYRYNFMLCTDVARKNFKSQAQHVNTPDGTMLMNSFITPISSFKDNMSLNVIRASDGRTETAFGLKQWVETNMDAIDDINEFWIMIQYGKNGDVKIHINSWGDIEVDPEWPKS